MNIWIAKRADGNGRGDFIVLIRGTFTSDLDIHFDKDSTAVT